MKPTSDKHKKQIKSKVKKSSLNQVRIVAGLYKRRNINFIDSDGLRPTPDRLRETLFNWLMYNINEATVLDACAGSGVLGFEALSRGATHVTFIEANQNQWQQLIKTADKLKLATNKTHILHGNAEVILKNTRFQNHSSFDIIFLDPPYSLNLWLPILQALDSQNLISNHTLIYIEANKPIEKIFINSKYQQKLRVLKSKKVGQVYSSLINFNQIDTSSDN